MVGLTADFLRVPGIDFRCNIIVNMTLVEAVDSSRPAPTGLTREDTIGQVINWCQTQEALALSQPGKEINLALYRRDWDHLNTFCPGMNLSGRSVDEAIKQYVDAVTYGTYSHRILLDQLASLPLESRDNVAVRQILVDTYTPQLQFGVREYFDPDGHQLLGREYFLKSVRPRSNLFNFLRRNPSSDVPLSMTGSFW